jgi:hypothetical protein
MPGVFLDFALHVRSLLFMNIFCSMLGVLMILRNIQISTAVRSAKLTKLLAWSAKCSSIIQSYHMKALTPEMEFKSKLFHPTKIKIELTSFENFENELFTIFIKKTLTHLN